MISDEPRLKVRVAGLQHLIEVVHQECQWCLDTLPGEEAVEQALEEIDVPLVEIVERVWSLLSRRCHWLSLW